MSPLETPENSLFIMDLTGTGQLKETGLWVRSWQTTYMIFDNQAKIWGGSIVGLGPSFLGYLRLKYCLDALRCTQGNILDVGCGGGGFAASVKTYRPDLNIYAIDVNKRAVFSASKEIHRVLKPRGVFHVFVPLEGEWYTLHNLLYKFGGKAKVFCLPPEFV